MKTNQKNSGFTLIELLVVISIISFLSSVVFGALNNARLRARDAAIKQDAIQFKNLLELEYLATKSYNNLYSTNWIPYSPTCASSFSGTYAVNARAVCDDIVKNSEFVTGWTETRFFPYLGYTAESYSIRAWLPSKQRFLCVGSNGKSSETTTVGQGVGNDWTAPGCPGETTW